MRPHLRRFLRVTRMGRSPQGEDLALSSRIGLTALSLRLSRDSRLPDWLFS